MPATSIVVLLTASIVLRRSLRLRLRFSFSFCSTQRSVSRILFFCFFFYKAFCSSDELTCTFFAYSPFHTSVRAFSVSQATNSLTRSRGLGRVRGGHWSALGTFSTAIPCRFQIWTLGSKPLPIPQIRPMYRRCCDSWLFRLPGTDHTVLVPNPSRWPQLTDSVPSEPTLPQWGYAAVTVSLIVV